MIVKGITRNFRELIELTWPMVLVSIVIVVAIRVCFLIKNKKHLVLYRELIMLSMIIYTLMLFQVVTNQDVVSWSSNNFIPFKEMFRYKLGSALFFKNVLGNLIMFLPFGFYVAYTLRPAGKKVVLILSFMASLTIEVVQLSIGRVFDVDDIILNVIGGILGYFFYVSLNAIKNHLPKFLQSDFIYNIICIIILIIAVIYCINLFGGINIL